MTIGGCALLALVLLCGTVRGDTVQRQFEVPDKRFGQMWSFGFLPGGQANVSLRSSVRGAVPRPAAHTDRQTGSVCVYVCVCD